MVEQERTSTLIEAVVFLLSMLMYKPFLSPLSVRLLGAPRVWYEMMVTVINVHLTVARGGCSDYQLYIYVSSWYE